MSIETLDTASGIMIKNKFEPNIEEIQAIFDNLESVERHMSRQQYIDLQEEEALGEENKKEAAEAHHKDAELVSPDEAMMYYALSGKVEEFAIRNMQFRDDQTLEYIKNYYKKYLPEQK